MVITGSKHRHRCLAWLRKILSNFYCLLFKDFRRILFKTIPSKIMRKDAQTFFYLSFWGFFTFVSFKLITGIPKGYTSLVWERNQSPSKPKCFLSFQHTFYCLPPSLKHKENYIVQAKPQIKTSNIPGQTKFCLQNTEVRIWGSWGSLKRGAE